MLQGNRGAPDSPFEVHPGLSHFEKWYNSIKDNVARSIVFAKLTRLADPQFAGFKSVGAGVFELRSFAGPGYRIYFALKGNQLVVLLGGGDKSSQKEDIDAAKKIWKTYKDETQKYRRKLSV